MIHQRAIENKMRTIPANQVYRVLYKYGYLGYAALLVLSVLFFKERAIFMDSAFHLFHIIVTDDFAIQNHRFGAVVTQVFPLLSSRLGLSLNITILIYSAGIILYYAACYFICGGILKQHAYALLLLLFNLLLATDTFFWMHSELPQGCAAMIVTFALMSSTANRKHLFLKYVAIAGLLIVVAFFHPLIFFPATFLFLYFIQQSDKRAARILLVISFAVYLAAWYVKLRFYKTPYDTTAMASATDMFARVRHFFALYSTKMFLKDCIGKFSWLSIGFIFTLFFYARRKKWINPLLYVFFVTGYILLINTSYPGTATPGFYIENMYLPLGIFVAAPLIFELGGSYSTSVATIALVFVMATGIARILFVSDVYTSRLDWEREFLKLHENDKLIVHERHVPSATLIMTWATSYEFWLLSTIENKKTASIIISSRLDELIPPPGKSRSFITQPAGYPYSMLPARYFIFEDTVSEYKVIR